MPGWSDIYCLGDDFDGPLHFRDGEDPLDRGTSGSLPLGRAAHLQAFREVIPLTMGFFPTAKPNESAVVDSSLWFEDFGAARQWDPRIFLALFYKLAPVKKEIEEKFDKAAEDKKKATPPCQAGVIFTV